MQDGRERERENGVGERVGDKAQRRSEGISKRDIDKPAEGGNRRVDGARESQMETVTVKDIWAGRQSGEKEGRERERELETDRQTQTERERERYMTPLSLSNNGSSCGAQLSGRAAGIRNVECGISGLEVIATVCV